MTGGLAGLILAGGRSSRFGREKAVAMWRGAPLISHVADRFSGCEGPAISAKPESGAALWASANGLPVLPDPADAPDGPLSGLREGLRWAYRQGRERLAVAPCDTPALPEDVFDRLTLAIGDGVGGAVAETVDGLQPLIAVWNVAPALAALENLMAAGAHPPVRDLLAPTRGIAVRFDPPTPFANLNCPHDLDNADRHERNR